MVKSNQIEKSKLKSIEADYDELLSMYVLELKREIELRKIIKELERENAELRRVPQS